jgi:hypothetical protein
MKECNIQSTSSTNNLHAPISDAIVIVPQERLLPLRGPSSCQLLQPQIEAHGEDAPLSQADAVDGTRTGQASVSQHQEPATHNSPPKVHPPTTVEGIDNINPKSIDAVIQSQGKELHELLQLFKQATSEPLCAFVLKAPLHKTTDATPISSAQASKHQGSRKSPRLQEKSISSKGRMLLRRPKIWWLKSVVSSRKTRS